MPGDNVGSTVSERFETTNALIKRIRGSVAALQSIADNSHIKLAESRKALNDVDEQLGRALTHRWDVTTAGPDMASLGSYDPQNLSE